MTLKNVATEISKLTYAEMMEMAEWLSHCSFMEEDGSERDAPGISRERMASNLEDWSREAIAAEEG